MHFVMSKRRYDFKKEYRETKSVSVTPSTYTEPNSAAERIRGIYQQTRGSIDRKLAARLWFTFFAPLLPRLAVVNANDYDKFIIRQMLGLAGILRKAGRGDFGHAQKMVNLFVKDQWALNGFASRVEKVLHLPLDRRVLSKLADAPASWAAFKKVRLTPTTRGRVLKDYTDIQDTFRRHWRRVGFFASPLEMEQFIWSRIQHGS